MLTESFAQGSKDIAFVIPQKYYNWKQFVGSNYGIAFKRLVPDFANRMITVASFELASGKKPTKKQVMPHIEELLEYCDTKGIDKLLVANAEYFKILSGQKSLEESIGYTFSVQQEGYGHITVLPMLNAVVVNAQPQKKKLLDKAIETASAVINGTYTKPEEHSFESYKLVDSVEDAREAISTLLEHKQLACDIETTGLRVGESEILTIAFAWDMYNAITFPTHNNYTEDADKIVSLIKDFLKEYTGKLIFHNASFDVKQLVYCWFMQDFSNTEGMYEGLATLDMGKVHDTMLMAYAELNSTERPQLGLKVLAKDFMGEWAEDTKDCSVVPLDALALYNARDVAATMYLYNKYRHQEESRVYTEILQPSLEYLIHEMLNGIPISMEKVEEALEKTTEVIEEASAVIEKDQYVKQAEAILAELLCIKYNKTHVGQKESWEFSPKFNPGSSTQLRILLFDVMGFEPIEFTDTGAPKTDRASIKEFRESLLVYGENCDKTDVLDALISLSETAIVKNTFLTAFKELSILDKDGNYTLHGNHRLGGTISGRLSSSEPNMANMPSTSRHAKLIKECIVAPAGWLYAYSDFNALEDRVSTLLTKDPMKVKEVIGGFEGHSLRASFYFKDELESRGIIIDTNDKESVNRVQAEAKDLRQASKPITFLKIYGGGAGKIQKVLKCSQLRAQEISEAFDELYAATAEFNERNTRLAKTQGYLDVAFGLRVFCPRINSKDSGIASGEGRSINNASTQSYGMLTNRASIEFLQRLKGSEYRADVKLVNQVHDCIYLLVRNDANVVKWVNDNLIACMQWKNDKALEGPVPMEAELDIGFDAAHCITIKNGIDTETITEILNGLANN